jgi:hypothetical protein
VKGWAPVWGQPNPQTCPSYAQRWCSEGKAFTQTPHGRPTGVAFFRSQFEQMRPDEHVCWRPYDELVPSTDDYGFHSFLYDLPAICSEERHVWFAQVQLVFLAKRLIHKIYSSYNFIFLASAGTACLLPGYRALLSWTGHETVRHVSVFSCTGLDK